jgi:hypothetical protein|tara:strand:+ start:36444 stop:36782 length:339 start_codon:yes stop_codon:yes gene_type:complete
MLKRWVAAMLVVFLAVNGLVVAGDSTIHASHDTPGLSLHADGDIKNVSAAFPMDADDGGYHDCHNPAWYAPLSASVAGAHFALGNTWPPNPRPGAVLSGRQPPVPPPNTVSF